MIGQRIRMAFGDKQPFNVKQVNNAELIAQGYPSEGWLLVRLGDNPIADHVGDFGQDDPGLGGSFTLMADPAPEDAATAAGAPTLLCGSGKPMPSPPPPPRPSPPPPPPKRGPPAVPALDYGPGPSDPEEAKKVDALLLEAERMAYVMLHEQEQLAEGARAHAEEERSRAETASVLLTTARQEQTRAEQAVADGKGSFARVVGAKRAREHAEKNSAEADDSAAAAEDAKAHAESALAAVHNLLAEIHRVERHEPTLEGLLNDHARLFEVTRVDVRRFAPYVGYHGVDTHIDPSPPPPPPPPPRPPPPPPPAPRPPPPRHRKKLAPPGAPPPGSLVEMVDGEFSALEAQVEAAPLIAAGVAILLLAGCWLCLRRLFLGNAARKKARLQTMQPQRLGGYARSKTGRAAAAVELPEEYVGTIDDLGQTPSPPHRRANGDDEPEPYRAERPTV